jgi:hypothetical protein
VGSTAVIGPEDMFYEAFVHMRQNQSAKWWFWLSRFKYDYFMKEQHMVSDEMYIHVALSKF